MAQRNTFFGFFVILFSLCISMFPSGTYSRSLPPEASDFTTSTVLDISASLQQAQQVLSFNPQFREPFHQQQQQQEEENSLSTPTSSFSVQLHPRDNLQIPQHDNYKSLVLARLDRDSFRVKSLTTKLQIALNHVNQSDLHPVEMEFQPEDLSTPVSSGISQGSGEYFCRIGVGTPAKSLYMVLDTGSDINWLQCHPCGKCYKQADPIFDPKASSSYNPLTCNTQQCQALDISKCQNGKCLYQVSYGDGSFTVGDYVTETVSFGNSGSVNNVALGCGHDNEGLFVGSAGLLGLGGGPLSLPSQIKSTSFSYCLVDRDSGKSSTLDFNSARPSDSVTVQLLKNSKTDTFYYIELTGISVGGQQISIPPSTFALDPSGNGGIIVDSGTSITRLRTEAYNSLRDAFVKVTQNLSSTAGFSLFDTCYDLSSQTAVSVPTVSFQFSGGKSLLLPAKNYLIPVDNSGTFCFAFAPTTSSRSIIGNVQQQGTRVSFDLANSVVGFSPNKC
ncbi:protein ASPARTIC PROTEASE IN GUARD CELL 1-like [Quillaja saponaria]|uniref:Protein ASPARTIC PROTEASE IN GUARD CELL 1-like n=1 Tax=Quillaja saponaria TaxID=32244 RepID=A0AAD7Q2Z2_QUISA|nr:protein ASPARTIC PROTEASE IN GUARD CELL 1-like [Quillaja saponaria]